MSVQILHGDCRDTLKMLPDKSVQCVVTSPPYWGLRSYLPSDHPNKGLEIGQEKTPQEYVNTMLSVFREVWRVLRNDGTLWLNLGDSYSGSGKGGNHGAGSLTVRGVKRAGLKPKDLIGIPWRVALAMQEDGWYLRSDIIWAKPNCMPESVTDRPTRSHEYIFLLTKSRRYFYDHNAIKEPCIYNVDGSQTLARKARQKADDKSHATPERNGWRNGGFKDAAKMGGKHSQTSNAVILADKQRGHSRRHQGFNSRWDAMERSEQCRGMRNKRDVWTIAPAQYRGAHFATFPKKLITPCILAGSRVGDLVLDPFGGSGTAAEVAISLGRNPIICELNADYLPLINQRAGATK